jgi:repressor LexA
MSKNGPLTERQQRALEFIRTYIADHGYAPSYEEIRQHIAVASLNAVRELLVTLERKGYLRRESGRSRAITVQTDQAFSPQPSEGILQRRTETLTIIGTGPVEGSNILSLFLRPRGLVSIDAEFFRLDGKSWFAAIASDDTFAIEGINAGDVLIIEQTDSPTDGTLVLCVAGGKQVLRRYRHRAQADAEFHAPNRSPLTAERDRVVVLGVVRWLVRQI